MADSSLRSCQPGACVEVTGGTAGECTSVSAEMQPIGTGVTAKIPAGLAQLTAQININAVITLPEPAIEIKDIKKRVKITQCKLLQPTNTLFIKGIIRKNINYATRQCSNTEGICGDVRHCTVDVPFRCTTTVNFNLRNPANLATNSMQQFEFFRKMGLPSGKFAEKGKLLSGDLSQFNQISTAFFNEPPFCDLVSARIIEFDEYLDRRLITSAAPFEEREFKRVEEKTVVFLTLRIQQKRNVSIPPCGAPFAVLACPR